MTKPEVLKQDVASLGWRTAADQNIIYGHRIAVFGAGGAGGGVAESAVREGMSLTITDPDNFDVTNLNRQTGSYLDTIGENKAKSLGDLACRIRGHGADVRVFEEGLTYQNIDEILKDATIVLDAIDIGRPDLSIHLARRARAANLPVFMGIEIGYGCVVTCFLPDGDENATVERYFGVGTDEVVTTDTVIPLEQILVHMPSYTPKGMLEAFASGNLLSTPGLSPGVLALSGVMMTMIERYALSKYESFPQFVYPNLYVNDPIDGIMVVHAEAREEHLAETIAKMNTNPCSSGFSTADDYVVK